MLVGQIDLPMAEASQRGEPTIMLEPDHPERDRLERVMRVLRQSSETLFDNAPIMMHSADRDFRLVDVNRRWLQTLRYRKDEVLGRQPFEFLTQESRPRHVGDVVPLFLSAGMVRSVGVRLVRKDNQVLDMVLDVDAVTGTAVGRFTYAALYDGHDQRQWTEASTLMQVLRALTRVESILASILSEPGFVGPEESGRPLQEQFSVPRHGLAEVLELAPGIRAGIRTLILLHQERLHDNINYYNELALVLDTVENAFTTLTDITA